MKTILVLLALVTSMGVSAQSDARLFVLKTKVAEGIDASTRDALSALIADTARKNGGIEVYSRADLERGIELEAERQTLGCDDVDCLSELAGAVSARFALASELTMLGTTYVLRLSILDTESLRTLASDVISQPTLEELAPRLPVAVALLVKKAVPTESKGAVACEAGTFFRCRDQCNKGDGLACVETARMHAEGGVDTDRSVDYPASEPQEYEYLRRACERRSEAGCVELLRRVKEGESRRSVWLWTTGVVGLGGLIVGSQMAGGGFTLAQETDSDALRVTGQVVGVSGAILGTIGIVALVAYPFGFAQGPPVTMDEYAEASSWLSE
jgi:hypothetical protein